MEVPLHEIANYPRFHDAARAVLSLARASIGDHAYLLIEHCSNDEALVLKTSGDVPDGWREGHTLAKNSGIMHWLDAGGSSSLPDGRFADACAATIRLMGGRRFGYLIVLAHDALSADQGRLLNDAAAVLGFALDSETRMGHDRLTGLYSRSMFDDHLRLELHRARRNGTWLAVIIVGYELPAEHTSMTDAWWLSRIAERLQSSVRQGDTIARVGGREIALIAPDLRDDSAARRVVQTLVESLEDPFDTNDGAASIHPFAGASLAPVDGFNADLLFERAHTALRHIGQSEHPGFLFHSDLRRLTLLNI